MPKLLNKSRRYRLSEDTFNMLSRLQELGFNESKFVRESIKEKFERDLPKIVEEQKLKQELIECPF